MMIDRIAELLARVPVVTPPPARNDASTLARLSEGLDPRLAAWARHVAEDAVTEALRDVSPARFDVVADDLGRAIESISINLLHYLVAGRYHPTGVRVSPAQRRSTQEAARIDIPLARVVGGLRALDHRWRAAFIELALVPPVPADAAQLLTFLDRTIATYFGALVDQNSHIYREEHQRLVDLRILGQRQLLERIIAGSHVDDAAVAEALEVSADDEHTCLIVSSVATGAGAPGLDFAAHRQAVARRFAPRTVTSVPVDQDIVWLFVSGRALDPDEARAQIAAAASDAPGARVSIGLPAVGTAGLRTTYLTASLVHDLTRRSTSIGPVASFADDALLALVAQTPELARLFVAREIGPLLEPGPLMAELRETLRTLLDLGGSLVRTAETLYVHRNTVAYRLKRLEEVLRRDPLARPVETRMALLLAEHLPA